MSRKKMVADGFLWAPFSPVPSSPFRKVLKPGEEETHMFHLASIWGLDSGGGQGLKMKVHFYFPTGVAKTQLRHLHAATGPERSEK